MKFCAQPITSTRQVDTKKYLKKILNNLNVFDTENAQAKIETTKEQRKNEKLSHDLVDLFFQRS